MRAGPAVEGGWPAGAIGAVRESHRRRLPWFGFLWFVPVILAPCAGETNEEVGETNEEVEQCVASSLSSLSSYKLIYQVEFADRHGS